MTSTRPADAGAPRTNPGVGGGVVPYEQRRGGVESRHAADHPAERVVGPSFDRKSPPCGIAAASRVSASKSPSGVFRRASRGPQPPSAGVAPGPRHLFPKLYAARSISNAICKKHRASMPLTACRAQSPDATPEQSPRGGFAPGSSREGSGALSSSIAFLREFVEPSACAARTPKSPIAVRVGWVGRFTKPLNQSTNAMGVAMHASIREQGPPDNATDRQPESTGRNEPQRGQRDFGGVAEMKEPVFIDLALVRMCKDELDAVNLCIDLSRQKDEVLCSALGIDKGHWSRIRKGMAHFPTKQRLNLMRLAGNWAPLQYELDRSRVLDRLKAELLRDRNNDGFADWIGRAA